MNHPDSFALRPPQGWELHPDFARVLAPTVAAARRAGVDRGRVGLVLGSGLGNVVDAMEVQAAVEFADLPGIHASTVTGHAGRLVLARAGGVDAIVLQGRLHAYEGRSLAEVVLPTALLCALGVRVLVLTNAAGGLHPDMAAGDLTAAGRAYRRWAGDQSRAGWHRAAPEWRSESSYRPALQQGKR